mmetsp:Transcript_9519/g.13943  ORF Transcript_9519/g.13943 Transcript_9519/m.13943 type:complete len:331 (+) Transcript_9519:177-1169(+)|eukprot:CAMPEP_0194219950 /NCGR_PEP_ID=MMETSP0156-20130528/27218_1 /TAXON_ID=33649 /ORGANISM="Thalassionema nitzschioides, Strain L26-B" /LENGTH=330 /DNA_ID=CAMNT_0038949801 /DNA_START=159 /DNA_END=1151 /DNA_ORIENTATION=-
MKHSNVDETEGDEWEFVSEDHAEEIVNSNIHDSTIDDDERSAATGTSNHGNQVEMVHDDLILLCKADSRKNNSEEEAIVNETTVKSNPFLDKTHTQQQQKSASEYGTDDAIMNEDMNGLIDGPGAEPLDVEDTCTLEKSGEPSDTEMASSVHSETQDTGLESCEENRYEQELKDSLTTIGSSFRKVGKTMEEETLVAAQSVKKALLMESKLIGKGIQKKADKITHAVKEAYVKHDIKEKTKKAEEVAKAAVRKVDDVLKSVGQQVKSFNEEHKLFETMAAASLIGAGFFLTKGHAPAGAMLLATGGAIYVAGESMKSPSLISDANLKTKF